MEGAKGALRTGEADLVKKALDELNSAYSAAGASLYQSAQSFRDPSRVPVRRPKGLLRARRTWSKPTTRSLMTPRSRKALSCYLLAVGLEPGSLRPGPTAVSFARS